MRTLNNFGERPDRLKQDDVLANSKFDDPVVCNSFGTSNDDHLATVLGNRIPKRLRGQTNRGDSLLRYFHLDVQFSSNRNFSRPSPAPLHGFCAGPETDPSMGGIENFLDSNPHHASIQRNSHHVV